MWLKGMAMGVPPLGFALGLCIAGVSANFDGAGIIEILAGAGLKGIGWIEVLDGGLEEGAGVVSKMFLTLA